MLKIERLHRGYDGSRARVLGALCSLRQGRWEVLCFRAVSWRSASETQVAPLGAAAPTEEKRAWRGAAVEEQVCNEAVTQEKRA